MKSLNKLFLLAAIFESKLQKYSGLMGAAPEDIENALRAANLFETSTAVGPLLNAAKIPADSSVLLNISFDTGKNPSYLIDLQPPNPAQSAKLSDLLKGKFFAPMKKAVSNLDIKDPVEIKWLKF